MKLFNDLAMQNLRSLFCDGGECLKRIYPGFLANSWLKLRFFVNFSYANTYLECVYTEVHRFCGVQAAEWQKGFDDILIQRILRVIGCKKGMSRSSNNSCPEKTGRTHLVGPFTSLT